MKTASTSYTERRLPARSREEKRRAQRRRANLWGAAILLFAFLLGVVAATLRVELQERPGEELTVYVEREAPTVEEAREIIRFHEGEGTGA